MTAELGDFEVVDEFHLEEVVLEDMAAPIETPQAGVIPAESRVEPVTAEALKPEVEAPAAPDFACVSGIN